MDSKCIAPGHWEIENWTVQQDQTTAWWWVSKFDRVVSGPHKTLTEAREWIAADLDSIDIGMRG
jgi:hypothetical protein